MLRKLILVTLAVSSGWVAAACSDQGLPSGPSGLSSGTNAAVLPLGRAEGGLGPAGGQTGHAARIPTSLSSPAATAAADALFSTSGLNSGIGPDVVEAVRVHVSEPKIPDESVERYNLVADRHADGSVTGEVEIFETLVFPGATPILKTRGEVTCFTVAEDGKTAYVGFVVLKSEFEIFGFELVGTEGYATVVDNGTPGAGLDLSRDAQFGWEPELGTAANHCENGTSFEVFGGFPLLPIANGEVSVFPAD